MWEAGKIECLPIIGRGDQQEEEGVGFLLAPLAIKPFEDVAACQRASIGANRRRRRRRWSWAIPQKKYCPAAHIYSPSIIPSIAALTCAPVLAGSPC